MDQNYTSLHAEHHAVNKLKYSHKKKKVDLIVFRTSNHCQNLLLSAPCENCRKKIKEGLKYKGYSLNRVYFTNNDGNLEFIKSNEL